MQKYNKFLNKDKKKWNFKDSSKYSACPFAFAMRMPEHL